MGVGGRGRRLPRMSLKKTCHNVAPEAASPLLIPDSFPVSGGGGGGVGGGGGEEKKKERKKKKKEMVRPEGKRQCRRVNTWEF